MRSAFFSTGAHTGAWNMAFDRLLMEEVREYRWDLVLRVYGWEPACVSIGKLQDPDREVDRSALSTAGIGLVRRPTGGRAVWHQTEVTYSVTARVDHPLVSGPVSEALKKVAQPLAEAVRCLGIPVSLGPAERHHAGGPREPANPCFTSHGRWEVGAVDGRKLIGSAQARSRGVFLEHGSILLENDQIRLLDFLPRPMRSTATPRLRAHLKGGIATLREFLPGLEVGDVERSLFRSFSQVLDGGLQEADPATLEGPRLDLLTSEQEVV